MCKELSSQDFTGICPVDEDDKEELPSDIVENIEVIWVEKGLPNPEPVNFAELEDEIYLPMVQNPPSAAAEPKMEDDSLSDTDFNMFSSDDDEM